MYHNPGIEPRLLKIHTKILIPAIKDVPPFPRHVLKTEMGDIRYSLPLHTVAKGDTLWGIARKYDTTIQKILDVNPITVDTPIQPGQILNIPVEGGELLRW